MTRWGKRRKQKVVEVLSLYSLLREPVSGSPNNPWVAEVMVDVPPQAVKNGVTSIRRTVTIQAKDELAAYLKVLTEGV